MTQKDDGFGFLPRIMMADGDRLRLESEIQRVYPQLDSPRIVTARVTDFYPGFVLLHVEEQLGAKTHALWALAQLASGLVHVIDGQGTVIDRIDRFAPLSLSDATSAANYLRLRFAFMDDPAHERRFGLIDLVGGEAMVLPESAGIEASLRVFYKSGDRRLREAVVRVQLKSGEGIVAARIDGAWRSAGIDAQRAADKPPLVATEVARVATPYFIDAWEDSWRAPARPAEPSVDEAAWAATLDLIPQPYRSLLDNFGIDKEQYARTIVRSSPLSFYRSFRLFELVLLGQPGSAAAEVGYCLGRPPASAQGEWEFRALNGTSPPIHAVNAAKGEDGLVEIVLRDQELAPAEVGTSADPVADYIRFFCWAVEGEDGPFLVPDRLERLEMSARPPEDIRQAIDATGLLPRMQRSAIDVVPPEKRADGMALRKAIVFYSCVAFQSVFKVMPNGMIDMLEDTLLAGDRRLPIALARMRAAGRRPWTEPAADTPEPSASTSEALPALAQPEAATREEDGVLIAEHHAFDAPDAIMALLEGKRGGIFRSCRFRLGLNLRGRILPWSLAFENCTFERAEKAPAAIVLSEAQMAGSLRFVDCHIRGDMHASQANIVGTFSMSGCALATHLPSPEIRQVPLMDADWTKSFQDASSGLLDDNFSIDLSGITVCHDLFIGAEQLEGVQGAARTIVTGSIVLSRAVVKRDLLFCGLWCRNTINAVNAEVAQDCMFGSGAGGRASDISHSGDKRNVCLDVQTIAADGLKADNLFFGHLRLGEEAALISGAGMIDLSNVVIAKNVQFRVVAVGGELSFYAADVRGNVAFYETRVNGSVSAVFATIHLFFWAGSRDSGHLCEFYLHCRGDLLFSASSLGGIELSGVQVDGDMIFVTGQVGCLYLSPGLVRSSRGIELKETRLRQLVMKNVEVGSDVRLHAVRIGSLPDTLFECLVRWLDRASQTGIRIENSVVRGHFSTLPEDKTVVHALRLNHAYLARTDSGVREFLNDLEAQDGGGRRHATRVIVGDCILRANRFEGSVELRDMSVFGKLILADSKIDIDLWLDASRRIMQGTEPALSTRCIEADFEKLVCHGDADLTGLRIQKVLEMEGAGETGVTDWASGSGDLKLRDAEIKGDLLLVDREAGSRAQVDGIMDLSAVVANNVVITGGNIVRSEAQVEMERAGGSKAQVILERARFSRLEIIDPTPSSINLTAIEVARWFFGRHDRPVTPGDPVRSDEYIEILKPMNPFDRGVWLAVETDLRNQGRELEANEVYRAMRKQGRRYLSRWRKWFDSWSSITLSYGTRPWLPMFPLVAFFVFLVIVFSYAGNVMPTADLIQAQGISCGELYERGRPTLVPGEQAVLDSMQPACERLTPAVLGYSWNWGDGAYLALRHSIPVINLLSHDDWQAAHRPVKLPAWASCQAESAAVGDGNCWWEMIRVDALASLVSLYGWIVVPISLLFFGTKVFRKQGS